MSYFNDIEILLKKLLFEFRKFNPKCCRLFDAPDINTYYISLTKSVYIVLVGSCSCYTSIEICKDDNLCYDIMTEKGLDFFVNGENKFDPYNHIPNVLFSLDCYDDNGCFNEKYDIKYIISLIKNELKNIIII